MKPARRKKIFALLVVAVALPACGASHSVAKSEPAAFVQAGMVHLSALAARRLDIRTAVARDAAVPPRPSAPPTTVAAPITSVVPGVGGENAPPPVATTAPPPTTVPPPVVRRVIPFAAVLYQPTGAAYTYTNPSPLVYRRLPLTVDYVTGDLAVLNDGPPAGTAVVVVGGAELTGIETGVGAE